MALFWDHLAELVPLEILLDFMVQETTVNRGRHADNLAGLHSIRTNGLPTSIILPFLRRMHYLPQPSNNLSWLGTGTKYE